MSLTDVLLAIAHQYLAAVERGDIDEALGFLSEDVVQEESPIALCPRAQNVGWRNYGREPNVASN